MKHYMNNLPIIMGSLMAFITGAAGLINNKDTNSIYGIMIMNLIIFFIIGFLVKTLLLPMLEVFELNASNSVKTIESENVHQNVGVLFDAKVDEELNPYKISEIYEEEFSPLKVSQVIRKDLNNENRRTK